MALPRAAAAASSAVRIEITTHSNIIITIHVIIIIVVINVIIIDIHVVDVVDRLSEGGKREKGQ